MNSSMPAHIMQYKNPVSLKRVKNFQWNQNKNCLELELEACNGISVDAEIALIENGIYIRIGGEAKRIYSLVTYTPKRFKADVTSSNDYIHLVSQYSPYEVRIGRDALAPFISVATRGFKKLLFSTHSLLEHPPDSVLHRGAGIDENMAWIDLQLYRYQALYGLGEQFNSLNHKGRAFTLWAEDAFGLPNNLTYINIPWLMSTAGWGIFLPTAAPSIWDIGATHASTLRITIAERVIEAYIFFGSIPELLQCYQKLTGPASLPPEWSFGLWVSRCTYKSQDEVLGIAKKFLDLQIRPSVMHLDPGWLTDKNGLSCSYEWDFSAFPDPAQMIKELNDLGIRLSLWISPFVPKGSRIFNEADAKGYLVKSKSGAADVPGFPHAAAAIDFTNENASNWFKSILKSLLELGISVFKTDFGESAPFDHVTYFSGISPLAAHNLYGLLYQKTVFEACLEYFKDQVMVWGRSGYSGSQRYPIQWGGDTGTTWEYMHKALRGALSFMLSGALFTSFDVGGFSGTPPEDLYLRWSAMGLLFSHVRLHGTSPREPFAFGEHVVKHFQRLYGIRQALMPYILEQAKSAVQKGLPLIRPLVIQYQHDPSCHNIDFEYFLGEDLLIAPTLTPDTQQVIYFPDGQWVSMFNPNQQFIGPKWVEVPSPPFDKIWIFANADKLSVLYEKIGGIKTD
jgi:alpha-D-xyloside xylohydrolase